VHGPITIIFRKKIMIAGAAAELEEKIEQASLAVGVRSSIAESS